MMVNNFEHLMMVNTQMMVNTFGHLMMVNTQLFKVNIVYVRLKEAYGTKRAIV